MTYFLISFWRHWHRWVSILIVIPFSITLLTGILLSVRGFVPWVQPSYPKVAAPALKVSFDQMLTSVQSVPEAKMQSWEDVAQIDVRPKTGQLRLRSKHDHWEVQLDPANGAVLQVKKRRVSWLTALHEGAYFGPQIRYFFFLPAALGVFFLTVSGLILFTQPFLRKLRARRSGH